MQTLTKENLQEYAGRNGQFYSQFLARYQASPFFLSWNWAAFFFLPLWLAYRKLWQPLGITLLLQFLIILAAMQLSIDYMYSYKSQLFSPIVLLLILTPVSFIAFGIMLLANSLYLRKAERVVQKQKSSTSNAVDNNLKTIGISRIAVFGAIVLSILLNLLAWLLAGNYPAQFSQDTTAYIAPESEKDSKSAQLTEMTVLKEQLTSYTYQEDTVQELEKILAPYEDISSLSTADEIKEIVESLLLNDKFSTLTLFTDKKLSLKKFAEHHEYKIIRYAFEQKNWLLLKFLSEKGDYSLQEIDLMRNPSSSNESRALQYAIKDGDIDSFRWMIKEETPVIAKFYKGKSPLMLAVMAKNIDMIKLLLEKGADPNYKNHNGNSAISLALEIKNNEIISLFSAKISQKSFSIKALNRAISSKKVDIAKRMIDSGININQASKEGKYPLEAAIDYNQGSNSQKVLVKYLIDKGANTNQLFDNNKYPPLYRMIYSTKGTELITYAIKHGAKLDYQDEFGTNLLGIAFNGGNRLDKVKFFVEQDLPLHKAMNDKGEIPLHRAITYNQPELISLIINKMIEHKQQRYLNSQDNDGQTPLHLSVQKNNEKLVHRLLTLGVDTTLVNNEQLGALQAISYANSKTILALLETAKSKSQQISIDTAYCQIYVAQEGDKTKQPHCARSAEYFLQKNIINQTIYHYLLAGNFDKIIRLADDKKALENCRCGYSYIDIAHAHLLKGNKEKTREYYKIASDYSAPYHNISELREERVKTLERLYPGFTQTINAVCKKLECQ